MDHWKCQVTVLTLTLKSCLQLGDWGFVYFRLRHRSVCVYKWRQCSLTSAHTTGVHQRHRMAAGPKQKLLKKMKQQTKSPEKTKRQVGQLLREPPPHPSFSPVLTLVWFPRSSCRAQLVSTLPLRWCNTELLPRCIVAYTQCTNHTGLCVSVQTENGRHQLKTLCTSAGSDGIIKWL